MLEFVTERGSCLDRQWSGKRDRELAVIVLVLESVIHCDGEYESRLVRETLSWEE